MTKYLKEWRKKNRAIIRKKEARRYKKDRPHRIRRKLRARVCQALKNTGVRKARKTVGLVGCTVPELRSYIESKFKPGMSWENRSAWHIDHIKPCESFDLLTIEGQRACFHFTNLQPLWADENIAKGARL